MRAKRDGRNHVQNLIVESLADHLGIPLAKAGAIYRIQLPRWISSRDDVEMRETVSTYG